jgi:glycosyltransferase involved in cell wall biosynthesis
MSVRNGLPYVPATVESIAAQHFADFEFVIVDNASTDGSIAFLQEFASREPRVRLLLNERDLGHSGGLNRGLEACRGQWIARIDADDVALPQRFERQLAFVANQPRLKLASCLAYYIDSRGKRVGKTYHPLATPADFERTMATNEMIGLLHPGAFIDRELALRTGGYRSAFGAANDIDLWCRMAEAGSLVLVQQEYLMEYRIHPGQISAGKFFEARMQYEWARASAVARRAGWPEPSWEEFLARWKSAPWSRRLNRARKTHAKFLYRQAGLEFACGNRLGAIVKMAGASLLQPSYALGRLRGQALRTK